MSTKQRKVLHGHSIQDILVFAPPGRRSGVWHGEAEELPTSVPKVLHLSINFSTAVRFGKGVWVLSMAFLPRSPPRSMLYSFLCVGISYHFITKDSADCRDAVSLAYHVSPFDDPNCPGDAEHHCLRIGGGGTVPAGKGTSAPKMSRRFPKRYWCSTILTARGLLVLEVFQEAPWRPDLALCQTSLHLRPASMDVRG